MHAFTVHVTKIMQGWYKEYFLFTLMRCLFLSFQLDHHPLEADGVLMPLEKYAKNTP